jgi:SH3-like domain-containing protein
VRTRAATPTTGGLRWAAVLAALLLATPAAARAEEPPDGLYVRVRVDTANLRADPSPTAERVRQAYENEPLRVLAQRDRWLSVRDFTGESAWIYAPLTDRRATVVVVRDVVNVRERPGTAHPVAFTAERGVNLLVVERRGRWLRVEHPVGTGWIHDSLVWGGA